MESCAVKAAFSDELDRQIAEAAHHLRRCLQDGGHIYACGNGGSAADAQHFVAELVGRFGKDRPPLAAIALTTNGPTMTAVANDYRYDDVFARQVQGLMRRGDALLAISTSGNSPNILKAAQAASSNGARVVGLTGASGGELTTFCDLILKVPSQDTARVQESHIFVLHAIAELIECEG